MRYLSRLNLIVSVAIFGLLSLSSCGSNQTSVEHVANAKNYLDKGEYRPALIELTNAVQKDPKSVEGRWLLGKVALNIGENERAEKEIRKAMELGLSRSAALPTLVKAILLQGNMDRVLKESADLPTDMPQAEKAATLALRGQALVLQGKLEQARQTLDEALAIKSDSSPVHLGIAILNAFNRNYDVARSELDLAIKADPTAPEPWSVLGDLELVQGHAAEAEKAFTESIKVRKATSLEVARRALVRIQLKKFKGAVADIETLKKDGWKDHPYVSYVSGLSYFAQKKYPEALSAFELSYKNDPTFIPNQMYLATTHFRLGHMEQALGVTQKLISQMPGSSGAKRLLGAIQMSQAEYGAARDLLLGTLKNKPDDIATLNMLANLYLLEGNANQALEYALKAVSIDPKSKQSQDLVMTAKLLAGKKLDESVDPTDDAYSRNLLLAIASFKQGNHAETLTRATKLHDSNPDKVDPLNLMAASHLALNQWEKAKVELEQVLKLSPSDVSATQNIARIEVKIGDPKKAVLLLEPLVKAHPKDVVSALILADAKAHAEGAATSVQILEQAAKNIPGDQAIRIQLAKTYLQIGQANKTLEITRSVSDTQFQQQPALLELHGKALMVNGDAAGARAVFEKMVKRYPNSAAAHYYLSDSMASSGNAVGARKELERALQLDSKYLPARVGEIKMLVQLGQTKQAKEAISKLHKDFGERTEVLGIDGWFSLGIGDYAGAEKSFLIALKQKPDQELLILLTRSLWLQKKTDQAFIVMKDWLKGHPDDSEVLLSLGEAYLSLGKEAEAIAIYSQMIKLYPNYVQALNNLAWLLRDKSPKQAFEYAQRAYQLAPKTPVVLDTLGMLTLKNGDIGGAASLLRDAATRAPGDVQIQLHLAQILVQQKQPEEARRVLAAVVKKEPKTQSGKEAQALLDSLSASKNK